MIGSAMSGVTFVSVPGMVATSGFGYMQMALGFIAGQLVIAFVLIPLFYKMNLVSIYEYLEGRFGISTYKTGAWFFFLSKMTGASVRLYLVCLSLQLMVFGPLGLPFYINVILHDRFDCPLHPVHKQGPGIHFRNDVQGRGGQRHVQSLLFR